MVSTNPDVSPSGVRATVRWLKSRDVCARFSISRVSLWRWVKAGFPQPRQFGRALRWDLAEIEHWEAATGTPGVRAGPGRPPAGS